MAKRIRHLISWSAALVFCMSLPFTGCVSDGGTEVPNEIKGTLLTQSGIPVKGAQVVLFKVDFSPGDTAGVSPRFESRTNASGTYTFKNIPEGQYNLVATGDGIFAYKDSLSLSGAMNLGRDTLRTPGSVSGRVQLQPQHDPRSAIVEILGTNYFTNVDSDGGFMLKDLPQGTYRIRVTVILAGYTPVFRTLTILAGATDTLATPLEPFYSGIHTVTGLNAIPDSTGRILLRWNKTGYAQLQAYAVYRAPAGSSFFTQVSTTLDTVFIDTLYSASPRADQFAYSDSISRAFSYRVRILTLTDEIGPVWGSLLVTALPPSHWAKGQQGWLAAGNMAFSFIQFTSPSTGYGFQTTQSFSTVDGGLNWSSPSGTAGGFMAAHFPVMDTGYVVVSYPRGVIFKIAKGIWKEVTPVTSTYLEPLTSIHFPQSDTGYTVGLAGNIFKTLNGAAIWTLQSSGTSQDLYSIQCKGTAVCYAAGDSGILLKTSNGGSTWVKQTSGTLKGLKKVYVPAANVAYALETGEDGNGYVKTTNGGATWSLNTFPPIMASASSLTFQNADTGYAVGSGGVILKTVNGGTTWIQEISGTTNDLTDIQCPTLQVCYTTGWNAPLRVRYILP